MEVILYRDKDKERWREFVNRSNKATIAHQIGWRQVISQSLGHKPFYLMALDQDKVQGILPLFLVKTWWGFRELVSIPWLDYGGVAAENETAEKALIDKAAEIARENNAGFVEMRSVTASSVNLPERTDKVTFHLPTDDADKLWKGFDAKLRNQVRKADKSGLTTAFAREDGLDEFYKVFTRNMRDLGTPVWGKDLFVNLLREFPDNSKFILVKKDDETIAGGLVLTFKGQMYVPSASAYRWTLKMCPNHALYWRCIKTACEEGFEFFDFGRSTIDGNTFRFKKQWQPEPTQLTWQYYLNKTDEVPMISPQNPKYQLFINVWRRLPMPLANFLGPKVIKNFP